MSKNLSLTSVFSLTIALSLFACNTSKNINTSTDVISSTSIIPQGIKLQETVKKAVGKVVIPYKKYTLANGLTLILHQDNSDPLVHVDVTYHVGSSREELGKSGFAHFFEHMMFQGSQNVADEQHFKVVTQSGGDLNGTTNSDRTNYYQTVPKNQLEKILWLESDRMGYLLEAITPEKFEIQRSTVKNERQQNVDNRPYGRLNETVNQMIYPREHPYSWPVIGYMSDLERGNLTDLKQFFSRWYGPNNATLTIGGDIDEQQTLAWVKKYFSDIKQSEVVENLAKPLVSLSDNRYYSFEDNVSLPLLYISFPTVYAMHEDEPALDVLANILGNGSTSLFYKNLVKAGIAIQAGASHPCRELACQMNFYALPNPQQNIQLSQLEDIITQTLTDFEERGVNDDDLHKTKVGIETGTIYGLQSVSGKVSSLAFFETFTGNANFTEQEVARYNRVTKDDVMRVYRKYIKGNGAAVLSILPKGKQTLTTKPDNFTLPDVSQVASTPTDELRLRESAIQSNTSSFDRSLLPKSGKNPQVNIPEFWRKSFNNGLEVIANENTETPTVSLMLSIEGGPLLDPMNKAGLASITASLMEEGTTNYAKEELSNALAKLGSNISVGAAGRNTYINVTSLRKNLDATINLMLDVMFNPAFEQSAFDRIKNQLIQNLTQNKKDANALSGQAFKQLMYSTQQRVGLPDSGTIDTVSAITLTDVKDFYQQYFSPQYANLVVVGDINKTELLPKLDYLSQWKGPQYSLPTFSGFPEIKQPKIYFVDLPDATQSVIKLGRRSMSYDAVGDYFKASLMNYPLGGAFNSRINLNLREDKGYTYGASSGFSGGKTLGWFKAGASVKKAHTADAMKEVMKELKAYQTTGITVDESEFMRQAISQNEALSFETPRQKSGFLRQLLQFNLPTNYGEKQSEIIESITIDSLNNIAKKELSKPMHWLVVGDSKVVKPQLAQLGLPIIDLTLVK